MPNTTPEGYRVPASLDPYDLTNDLRKMMESITTVIPVPNVEARTTLVGALATAGRPVSPGNPLLVFREDAGKGLELEYTVDGTVWLNVAGERSANVTSFGPGWVVPSGGFHTPRVVAQGRVAHLYGAVARSGTSGVGSNVLTIPTAFQPPSPGSRFIGSTAAQGGVFSLLLVGGQVRLQNGYGAGSLIADAVVPLVATWALD